VTGRARLGPGDRVHVDGAVLTVVGVAGPAVRLSDAAGVVSTVPLSVLQTSPGFALAGAASAPVPAAQRWEGLPAAAVEQARWWEQHILEVLHGTRRDSAAGGEPRPEYDPAQRSLTRREQAKVAELNASGFAVTISTVRRHRQRYQAQGLFGLVDHRVARRTPVFGRVDEAVVAAMRTAIAETTDASSRTAKFVLWRTEQLLAADGEPVVMPSQRTSTGCSRSWPRAGM
jgi:putative transposase